MLPKPCCSLWVGVAASSQEGLGTAWPWAASVLSVSPLYVSTVAFTPGHIGAEIHSTLAACLHVFSHSYVPEDICLYIPGEWHMVSAQ